MKKKGRRVPRGSCFAILNVGIATDLCKTQLGVDLDFITRGEINDPSHTGIEGYAVQYNARVAAQLAKSVNRHEIHQVEK